MGCNRHFESFEEQQAVLIIHIETSNGFTLRSQQIAAADKLNFEYLNVWLAHKSRDILDKLTAESFHIIVFVTISYSSRVFTHSQPPLSLSFHRLTRLSPVLTASTFPLKLQLTRQATASTLRTVDFHSPANS